MRLLIICGIFSIILLQSGETKSPKRIQLKVGKPLRDPLVNSNKQGKKIAKKKPKTDAKLSDYDPDEKIDLPKANQNKQNQYETGPAPQFPEVPSTSDVTAHESEVNGCRDHPLAQCSKCNKACYGPEHETYLYAYCRKSCGFCSEKISSFHNFWRLRANSSFQPTWMLKEVEFYHDISSSLNIARNSSRAFASSNYEGFYPSLAFDHDNSTSWYPANYGQVHNSNDDWIGYEFPIAVRIHGVRIHNDERFQQAAPQTVLVEASDDKNYGYETKWVINSPSFVADKKYTVHDCPVLWKKYYDSDYTAWCYRLFAQAKTFDEASGICEEEGGQLASVLSNEQKVFILKDVKICVQAWIGLHKEDKAYYWLDGSDSGYHNWKEEHYTESQRENEGCVLMDEEGKWILERCEDRNYFICKQKLWIRPQSKPDEVPNPLPYEPEIPPLIFYGPHFTEPVANTKHLPQGTFPTSGGKFEDLEAGGDEDENTLTAILFKQSLKHLDEMKGQKPQVGTKPEVMEDFTAFTYKIDALAKKLGNEMNKNNSQIKPSNNLNLPKLPTLLKLEEPKVDMTGIPGVPPWNHTDDNDDEKQHPVGGSPFKKPQPTDVPTAAPNAQNQNNEQPSANPPRPVKTTKEEANKEQEKNPNTGPQIPIGNIKPPKPQEGGGNGQAPSIGEAGEEETNENDDNDNDNDDNDDDDKNDDEEDDDDKTTKKPTNQMNMKKPDQFQQSPQQTQQAPQQLPQQQQQVNQMQTNNFLFSKKNYKPRSNVTKDETESESDEGSGENKEINELLNSMKQD